MQLKSTSFFLALSLTLPAFACGASNAQTSVFSKTTPGNPQAPGGDSQNKQGWRIAVLNCEADKTRPCFFEAGQHGFVAATLPKSEANPPAPSGDLDLLQGETAAALDKTAGNAALLKLPLSIGDPADKNDDPNEDREGSKSLEHLFQLSETLEWRIEPGEMDGQNQVGVFTSRTLTQFGPNTALKFDAGVNVEAKNGNTAGKAGFVVAW